MITFILPGLGDSGPAHWQSQWERLDSQCRRIVQAEWDRPRCEDWVATLDRAIADVQDEVVLVAHSSACAMVAHWAAIAAPELVARVRGALLVGPSDPEGPNYPVGPSGFAPMPLDPLPFRSIVVASRDDMYATFEQARSYADAWESDLVDVGAVGHINSDSNLGAWPAGRALLQTLRQGTHRDVGK